MWSNIIIRNHRIENSVEDGHGTRERLSQSEGEIYRDVCVTILNIYSGDYKFKFYAPKNEE